MKKNSPAYVIGFMVAISAVFGIGIAVVHYLTLQTLESNERLYRNRTVARAFDLEVSGATATAYEQAIESKLAKYEFTKGNRLWEVYIRKEPPHTIGFVFSGMGFWDIIKGVLTLSPDLQEISNIEFLDQKETPGLGARIEEQWFRKQFKGYNIDWDRPGNRYFVFSTTPTGPQLSAITGATQTTMALERILNSELEAFRKVYSEENLARHQSPQSKESAQP